MDKPRKKIQIIGERRSHLDVARFADALIAFALHRVSAEADTRPAASADLDQARPS